MAVECDVTVVPESRVDGQIFIKGAKWASPKESNFKRKLKKLYNDSEKHKQAAKKLSEILISSHSADALALKYNEAFAGMFK